MWKKIVIAVAILLIIIGAFLKFQKNDKQAPSVEILNPDYEYGSTVKYYADGAKLDE